jgi:hypothetical protein
MPSACTMLGAYQAQLAASRGAGLAHLDDLARLGRVIRVLLELINRDYDPRPAVVASPPLSPVQ